MHRDIPSAEVNALGDIEAWLPRKAYMLTLLCQQIHCVGSKPDLVERCCGRVSGELRCMYNQILRTMQHVFLNSNFRLDNDHS